MDKQSVSGCADIHSIVSSRTDGDGMENVVDCNSSENVKKEDNSHHFEKKEFLRDKFIFHPVNINSTSVPPPGISGRIVRLKPAPIIVKNPKIEQKFQSLGVKEPKFVPYEPYKGAVNPMVPQANFVRKKKANKIKSDKQIDLKTEELRGNVTPSSSIEKHDNAQPNHDSEVLKREKMEKELERLQKENQQLENQLKFQIQVNGDLKNLLVASVGEDMETRVHILTEDKLHLARALLSSAQKLNTHQEQTEWLASQCEVWRSKFLASSIMVEELAKWKALLTRRVQDLHDTTTHLLEERLKVREYIISTYKDLSILCDYFDVTSLRSGANKLNSSNVLDLSEVGMQLSAVVRLQLLGNGLVSSSTDDPSHLSPATTSAETAAIELIKHPVPELENADAAYSAVMGAAIALGSSAHLFSPACCGQCTGEIKTI